MTDVDALLFYGVIISASMLTLGCIALLFEAIAQRRLLGKSRLSRLSPDSNSGASLPSSSEPTPGGAVGDGETFDEDTGTFQVERVNGGWC